MKIQGNLSWHVSEGANMAGELPSARPQASIVALLCRLFLFNKFVLLAAGEKDMSSP